MITSFIDVALETRTFRFKTCPMAFLAAPSDRRPHCGVAIGDFVLDLAVLEEAGVLDTAYFGQSSLERVHGSGQARLDRRA